MPLYFAYGSNMDDVALAMRCPKARKLGAARLPRHRFALMSSGYATVRRDPRAEVHGVLYDLALSDVAPLDRYEEIDAGLYIKAIQPVLRDGGGAAHPLIAQALIYLGCDESDGPPVPGYMEGMVAAARAAPLPATYIAMLEGFVPPRSAGPRRHR